MNFAPIGVFCLIASTFATTGWDAFIPLLKYMGAVLLALFIQASGTYMAMLSIFAKLNPIRFFKNFAPVMNLAFSTASSNASIPLNIETMEKRMGVSKSVASFTIPLGATINMDGTAIMQGVAVVFVSQVYGIELTLASFLTVILTATLASIGTAGVPGVGLVTLSMVLTSVGLPVEGIALIMGIDRLLDMTRTVVNITGDAVCTLIIAKKENEFDQEIFYNDNSELEEAAM
jgi:Na+/H+-dicarboxylate symporter